MPIFNQYDPGTASTFQYDNTVQQANADAIAAAKKKQRTAKILNTGLGIAEIAGGGIALATGAGAPLGVGLITSGAAQTIKGLSMGDGGYMPMNPQSMGLNNYNPYTSSYDPSQDIQIYSANQYKQPQASSMPNGWDDYLKYAEPSIKDVGSLQMSNGGMVNGGSHQSGHDLAIVDKNTGGDTGIRVEGGEMVFSKERTNALKHAYNQNDYNAVMRIVREQMHNGVNAHKLEGGTNELNLVPQGSSMNWNDGYPQNPSVINQIEYNTPYSTNRMVSDANELNIGTPINTKIQANSMNWDTGYANKFDPNIELAGMPTKYASQKDYGISPMQNPEMRLQQDYNAIETGATTTPSTPSGSWMDYIKYAIPAIQTGLGAYASQNTKLPEFTTPPEFNAMIALHKRQSGEGLSAQKNMLLDRAIQDTYTTGLNKIYTNSGGNAGAILGNQNALAGDVLNAKIKQAALNADQRKKNQDTYSEDVAKQLSLLQDAYKLKYAQAAGARAAGGNLMGVGLNNAQDMMMADALKKEKAGQDNTFANALEEYFKNKNKK